MLNLNEFQADWAAMPQVEKEKLEKLNNKTILVSGHSLARCLCYALIYQSERQKRQICVIYAGDTDGFDKGCTASEYFQAVDFDSLEEIKEIDYIIHTGYCREHAAHFSAAFAQEIAQTNALARLSRRTHAKVVLLSDSRVYGTGKPNRVYAENEYAPLDNTDPKYSDNQLLRTIESLWHCQQKGADFSLTVLRTGVILGACSGLPTHLDKVLQAVANGEAASLVNGKRLSYVYLTDVLRAVVCVLGGSLPDNETYNVTGKNCTVSAGMIAAVLHDVYGDKARLPLTDGADENACALSGGKMINGGCAPAIGLDTALELCVMSHMKDTSRLQLPNTHDGRLDAIQKMQLAYLLEVDRICKKHHIKYFLGGGTLLGAIRHNGFIPWDDDADIMMLREDYDRFAEVAQQELPAGMTFQSGKTDKNCFYEFNKLRVENTIFATELAKNHTDINVGIAFDIFCHDKTANSRLGQKLHLAATLFTRALVLNKWNHRKADNGSRVQSAVTNFFVRLLPLRFSYFLMNHTISFFKRKKNARYLYDGMGRNVYNGCFSADILSEVTTHDFEGYQLPVPKKYDEYLTFLYGDYMEKAPLSTRLGCHEILLCDIGKYDNLNE